MLIATDTTVYHVAPGTDGSTPQARFTCHDVLQVAEGDVLAVVAPAGPELVVLAEGIERRLSTGIDERITSLLLLAEDPMELLIGTEPPHMYRLVGDGPARRLGAFDALHVRSGWYTPWGGPPAVRSLAATPDGWLYADVHVGGIVRSADRGETWEPVTSGLHEDVHQVATAPAAPNRVYANTAQAVSMSDDRGTSWLSCGKGLGARYGRAVVVHPGDPDLALATVSDGPHGGNVRGQLYRTEDAGRTWEHVADGFPASTHDNIDTFHVVFAPDGSAWGVADHSLYSGGDRGTAWHPVWEAPDRIRMLAVRV